MWDLPGPGFEPVSPALAGGFLTTVPPGKFRAMILTMVRHRLRKAFGERETVPSFLGMLRWHFLEQKQEKGGVQGWELSLSNVAATMGSLRFPLGERSLRRIFEEAEGDLGR